MSNENEANLIDIDLDEQSVIDGVDAPDDSDEDGKDPKKEMKKKVAIGAAAVASVLVVALLMGGEDEEVEIVVPSPPEAMNQKDVKFDSIAQSVSEGKKPAGVQIEYTDEDGNPISKEEFEALQKKNIAKLQEVRKKVSEKSEQELLAERDGGENKSPFLAMADKIAAEKIKAKQRALDQEQSRQVQLGNGGANVSEQRIDNKLNVEDVKQSMRQTQGAEGQRDAGPSHVVTDREKAQEKFHAVLMNKLNELEDIKKNVRDNTQKLEQVVADIEYIKRKIDQLKKGGVYHKRKHIARNAVVEHKRYIKKTKKSRTVKNIIAMYDDGLIVLSKGREVPVFLGDNFRGYGRLISVNPEKGTFTTDRGVWKVE